MMPTTEEVRAAILQRRATEGVRAELVRRRMERVGGGGFFPKPPGGVQPVEEFEEPPPPPPDPTAALPEPVTGAGIVDVPSLAGAGPSRIEAPGARRRAAGIPGPVQPIAPTPRTTGEAVGDVVFGDLTPEQYRAGGLKELVKGPARGLASATGAVLDTAAILETKFLNPMGLPADRSVLGMFAGDLQRAAEALPPEPGFERGIVPKGPEAAGSMVPFAVAAILSGGSTASVAGLGALANASPLYREAKAYGADESTATLALLLGGAIGTLEAAGTDRLLAGLARMPPGAKVELAKRIGSAFEEGGQEGANAVLNDLGARLLYDPDREVLSQSALEQAGTGALLGGAVAAGAGRGGPVQPAPLQVGPAPQAPTPPTAPLAPLALDATGEIPLLPEAPPPVDRTDEVRRQILANRAARAAGRPQINVAGRELTPEERAVKRRQAERIARQLGATVEEDDRGTIRLVRPDGAVLNVLSGDVVGGAAGIPGGEAQLAREVAANPELYGPTPAPPPPRPDFPAPPPGYDFGGLAPGPTREFGVAAPPVAPPFALSAPTVAGRPVGGAVPPQPLQDLQRLPARNSGSWSPNLDPSSPNLGSKVQSFAEYRKENNVRDIDINHSELSPSGHVSERSRRAAKARLDKMFGNYRQAEADYQSKVDSGEIVDPTGEFKAPDSSKVNRKKAERLRAEAQQNRELAARGMQPRKLVKRAAELERQANELDPVGGAVPPPQLSGISGELPSSGKSELQAPRAPFNPYREKAERARAKADSLSGETSEDAALRESFPLGVGFGRKGSGEARLNRINKAAEAEKRARELESKAEAVDRYGHPDPAAKLYTGREIESGMKALDKTKGPDGKVRPWLVPYDKAAAAHVVRVRDEASFREYHRKSVEKALSAGEVVPPEVLADYPDLAPQVSAPPAPVASAPRGEAVAERPAQPTGPAPVPASTAPTEPASAGGADARSRSLRSPLGYTVALEDATPVDSIRVDAARFQFKDDTSESGVRKQDALKGEFDPTSAGRLLVWEAKDGTRFVVNGHHRLALAKSQGVETVDTQVLREADGVSDADARAIGAMKNIQDGTGEVSDYARFFRSNNIDEGRAKKAGLLDRAKGQNGWALGRLAGDSLFAQYINGGISERHAVAIARAAPGSEGRQLAGIDYALKDPKRSPEQVKAFLDALGVVRPTSGAIVEEDLFGNSDQALVEAGKLADAVTARQAEISDRIAAVQGAAKRPETARSLGVDVSDPEGVTRRIQELREERRRWDSWERSPELVAEARRLAGLEDASATAARKLFAGRQATAEKPMGTAIAGQAELLRPQLGDIQPETGENPDADPNTPDIFGTKRRKKGGGRVAKPQEGQWGQVLTQQGAEQAPAPSQVSQAPSQAAPPKSKPVNVQPTAQEPDVSQEPPAPKPDRKAELKAAKERAEAKRQAEIARILAEDPDAEVPTLESDRPAPPEEAEPVPGTVRRIPKGAKPLAEPARGKGKGKFQPGKRGFRAAYFPDLAKEKITVSYPDGQTIEIDGGAVAILTGKADVTSFPFEAFRWARETLLTDAENAALDRRYGTEERAATAYARAVVKQEVSGPFRKILAYFRRVFDRMVGDRSGEAVVRNVAGGGVRKRASRRPAGGDGRFQPDEPKTYGRPELALGAEPGIRDVDEARKRAGIPEPRTDKEVRAAADELLKDRLALRKLILDTADRGGQLNPEETLAAKTLVAQDRAAAVVSGDVKELADTSIIVSAYRDTGTEQARAFRQRIDPKLSPEERMRAAVVETLVMPSERDLRRIHNLRKKGDRTGVKAVHAEHAEKVARIKKDLAGLGIDVDSILTGSVPEADAFAAETKKIVEDLRKRLKRVSEGSKRKALSEFEGEVETLTAELKAAAGDKKKVAAKLRSVKKRIETLKERIGEAGGATAVLQGRLEALQTLKAILEEAAPQISPERAVAAIREIQAAKNDGIGGWSDAFYEYWINSILSGPVTHIANISGNGLNFFYDAALLRPIQAAGGSLARVFGADPDAPTLAELPHFYRGILPGIARGFRNGIRAFGQERSVLEDEVGGVQSEGKLEAAHTPAISGWKGRFIRTPGRALVAADDVFKSLAWQMNVGAEAYRVAKREGLTGDALAARIEALTADPSADIRENVLAAAHDVTFTTRLDGKLADAIRHVRRVPGARYVIPFVQTPLNIFRTGLRRTPLGSINLLAKIARHGIGKRSKRAGVWEYSSREFSRDAAEQLLAWGATTVLAALLFDDKDEPRITGSKAFGVAGTGERDLAYRNAPPNSIRIGGRWYSYERLEPFGSSLTVLVDAVNEAIRVKQGKKPEEAMGTAFKTARSLVQDKTFMRGLSDLIDAFESEERAAQWASNFASSWVPNIVRQPARATEPNILERGPSSVWARTAQGAFPAARFGMKPKVDLWGREVKSSDLGRPSTDFTWRLLSPVRTQAERDAEDPAAKLDRLLTRWNYTHPEDERYPSAPRAYFTENGQRVNLTSDEYNRFLKTAGERSLAALSRRRLNYEDPTERDLDAIEDAIRDARAYARKAILRERRSGEVRLGGADLARR